jgi:hypothetical protein
VALFLLVVVVTVTAATGVGTGATDEAGWVMVVTKVLRDDSGGCTDAWFRFVSFIVYFGSDCFIIIIISACFDTVVVELVLVEDVVGVLLVLPGILFTFLLGLAVFNMDLK